MTDLPEAPPYQRVPLLQSALGRAVARLRRYEVDDAHTHAAAPDFTTAEGPLLLTFADGSRLGFAAQPSLRSLTVWPDQDAHGTRRPTSPRHDPDLLSFEPPVNLSGATLHRWDLYHARRSGDPISEPALVAYIGRHHLTLTFTLPAGHEELRVSVTPDAPTLPPGLVCRSLTLPDATVRRRGVWWVETPTDAIQVTGRHHLEYRTAAQTYHLAAELGDDVLDVYPDTVRRVGRPPGDALPEAAHIRQRVAALLARSGDPYRLIREGRLPRSGAER